MNIAPNKKKHLVMGAVISAFAILFANILHRDYPAMWGIVVSTGIGVGWEYYQDETKTGQFDRKDMLATSVGGILFAILYKIVF